jgi:hypothetical protein
MVLSFQYDRQELTSIDIGRMVIADDEARHSAELIPQIFAGNAFHRTVGDCYIGNRGGTNSS